MLKIRRSFETNSSSYTEFEGNSDEVLIYTIDFIVKFTTASFNDQMMDELSKDIIQTIKLNNNKKHTLKVKKIEEISADGNNYVYKVSIDGKWDCTVGEYHTTYQRNEEPEKYWYGDLKLDIDNMDMTAELNKIITDNGNVPFQVTSIIYDLNDIEYDVTDYLDIPDEYDYGDLEDYYDDYEDPEDWERRHRYDD